MALLREWWKGTLSQKVPQGHRLQQVPFLDLCKILHLCWHEYIGVCEYVMWLLEPVPHAFQNVPDYVLWDCGLARLSWVLWCSAFPALLSNKVEEKGLCVVLSSIVCDFLLFPVPNQIRQRVHQILNMRGSSIKIVRHILKGELRYSYACVSFLPGTTWSSLSRMSPHM